MTHGKKETAAQRRERQRNALCGKCMQPIDLFELRNAHLLGTSYMHGCGKWLVKGGVNAEVSPITNHDDLSSSNPSESTSPSTGDA